MESSADITCRPARGQDLQAVAWIFMAAFAGSVEHARAGDAAKQGMQDLFRLALTAEPGALIVAVCSKQVVGYILASRNVSRLRWSALWRGQWLRILWRWLTGRYRIGWRTLRTIAADKLAFLRGAHQCSRHQARILSVAVHPDYQGKGVGRKLLEAGLRYLRNKGVRAVRLEVRPDNAVARHLYEKAGFRPCGEYADSQGRWLIMVLDQDIGS